MPRLRHLDHLGTARFVTFTCYRRHRYLGDRESRRLLLKEVERMRTEPQIKLPGYIIMPEHVHLVLLPPDEIKLGVVVGQMKARSAHSILSRARQRGGRLLCRPDGSPAMWQRRCHDHNCRSIEIVIEKLQYCHDNPVKRGLVSKPEDWPWSSSRWYLGRNDSLIEIDGIEL